MHHPWARNAEGRSGAVGADRCYHAILHNVAVGGGDHSLRHSGTGTSRACPYDIGSQQEVPGILGHYSAAVARVAVTRCTHGHIHWGGIINAAIFHDPDVRVGCGRIKPYGYLIRAGGGGHDVLRVINRLRKGGRSRQDRWAGGQCIDVTRNVPAVWTFRYRYAG